jgi:hypothetical protein
MPPSRLSGDASFIKGRSNYWWGFRISSIIWLT